MSLTNHLSLITIPTRPLPSPPIPADFILAFQLSDAKREQKHGSDDQDKRAKKRNVFRQKCEEKYGLEFEEQDCSVSEGVVRVGE